MRFSHFEKEKFNFPKDEFNFWQCSSLLPMNPLPFIYFHNKKILFFKGLHCNFEQIDRVLTFFWLHFWAVEIVSSLFQYQPMNWLLWQLHLRLPFEVLLLSEIEQSKDQDQLLDKYQTSTRPVPDQYTTWFLLSWLKSISSSLCLALISFCSAVFKTCKNCDSSSFKPRIWFSEIIF